MRLVLVCLLLLLLLLSACQSNGTDRTIDMYNASGDMTGTAVFSEEEGGVNIKIKVEGLSPGFHGIHVHEYAKCEGPDFKSAGNHFNPEGKQHGLMHPEGAHLGDLPNVESSSSGLIDIEIMLTDATLLDGKKSILQEEGTSLIITEDKDDGISQPGGNSGKRLICGELKKNKDKDETESPTDPTEDNKENEEEE